MKTIVVTTQKELDDLPLSFDEFTRIEIRSDEKIEVTIHRGSSRVVAYDSSRVVAYGSSQVVAHNTSSVIARGLSKVTAFNLSVVEAWDSSQVTSFERSNILVFSEFVSIKYLADYSTAKFIKVKDNILMKDETAKIIETPELNISFDTWLERGYVVADGIKRKFISKKEINGIEIFEVEAFLDKKTVYVVRRNGVFSHGETVEKAIESLRYKLSERDTSKFKSWKLDTEITVDEAIQSYRAITGACEYGVREFCESIKIPEKLTPGSVIKLTEGKFGYKEFKEFFK